MANRQSKGARPFFMLLGITLAVWVMRGLGILTFMPGAVLWILMLVTIGSGVVYAIQRSKRW